MQLTDFQNEVVMKLKQPAETWMDAMLMGNGRLCGMVYGHACVDRIQLNEDSLWYGDFTDRNNKAALAKLPEIRQCVLSGDLHRAEDLITQYLVGTPISMRHQETLGELDIALNQHTPFAMGWTPNSDDAQNVQVSLDLMRGVHTVEHDQDGAHYVRTTIFSYPAQVMCIHLTTDKLGSINLDLMLDRCRIFDEKVPDDRRPGKMKRGGGWAGVLLDSNHAVDDRTLVTTGNAAGTTFACALRVQSDGTYENPSSELLVRDASYVNIYLAGATSNREKDPQSAAIALLDAAEKQGWEALYASHVEDFERGMRACELDLGTGPDMSLDERIERVASGERDNNLTALFFTYARYMLMSGARENSEALPLQGNWNKDFVPAFDNKYTININGQMNYWAADVTGLGFLNQSLFSLIEKMVVRGRDTARIMYGCRGSCCHHNTDYYGDCAPQDVYMAATSWTQGEAWMVMHIWDHYLFTRDQDFLRKYYPILRENALFYLDFLTEDEDGYLVTNPSISPENRYVLPDGSETPICAGPAMDNQILRSLFDACIQSCEILGIEDELVPEFRTAASRLHPNKVGSNGCLLEWRHEVEELTPGMPHISHLWGVYPGSEINWKDTPDFYEAAHKSLQRRMDHGASAYGGWPLGWFICEWARFMNGERVAEGVEHMIRDGRPGNFFPKRWDGFSIDGIQGAVAGMAEALVQSHTGLIDLLPALPPQWPKGRVRGLKARGGYTCDIAWQDGKLQEAILVSDFGSEAEIKGDVLQVTLDGQSVPTRKTENGFAFTMLPGKSYHLA